MSGFNISTIEHIEIPNLPSDLPLIIDDCSLALCLGFKTSRLWYVLKTRDKDHYKQYKIKKKRGGYRILHDPSPILKLMQRNLLNRVLEPLQSKLGLHVAAYRPSMSVVDAVRRHIPPCPKCDNRKDKTKTLPKHDCPRAGTYINLDLKNFFPSTTATDIRKYLRYVGYSHTVASLMSNIMIVRTRPNFNYVPNCNMTQFFSEVPQGAPTSGAICNLIADRLIDQPILNYLTSKNKQMNIENTNYQWVYSRYADDLAFTCGIVLKIEEIKNIIQDIKQIINISGYKVNKRKTRFLYGTTYQRKLLGMVFTERPNYAQSEYRKLRAIIHNCATKGFESQYKQAKKESAEQLESWLNGVINWINQINPQKAEKLKKEFDLAVKRYGTQHSIIIPNYATNE